MPRLDGTGPTGQGSMTGRGMGNCPNNSGASRRYCPNCQGFWTLGTKTKPNNVQSLEELKLVKEQLEQKLVDINDDIKTAEKGK